MNSLGPITTATLLGWAVTITFTALSWVVIWKIYRNDIDLSNMLSENGSNKASLSRFQLLLFTYVVAGLYLILCIETGSLLEIPNGVLGLLGVSAGSYVVSKGISANAPAPGNTTAPGNTPDGQPKT